MKLSLLALVFTVFSQASFAAPIPGGLIEHPLYCSIATHGPRGISYQLVVATSALLTEKNVRSVVLNKRVLAPNAKIQSTTLKQVSQNVYNAEFKSTGVKVLLDKTKLEATLTVGNSEYLCK